MQKTIVDIYLQYMRIYSNGVRHQKSSNLEYQGFLIIYVLHTQSCQIFSDICCNQTGDSQPHSKIPEVQTYLQLLQVFQPVCRTLFLLLSYSINLALSAVTKLAQVKYPTCFTRQLLSVSVYLSCDCGNPNFRKHFSICNAFLPQLYVF